MRLEGGNYYITSEQEMLRLFAELPDAVHASAKIAAMTNIELEFGRIAMPAIDLPAGVTVDEHLRPRRLCAITASMAYAWTRYDGPTSAWLLCKGGCIDRTAEWREKPERPPESASAWRTVRVRWASTAIAA